LPAVFFFCAAKEARAGLETEHKEEGRSIMLTLAAGIEHALIGLGGFVVRATGLGQMKATYKGDQTTARTRRFVMELPATGMLSSRRSLVYPKGGGP